MSVMSTVKRLLWPRPLPGPVSREERDAMWSRMHRVSRRANELSASVNRWEPTEEQKARAQDR